MMKFSCEKALLMNAINVASRTAAQKSSIPALEGLLLRADGTLTISGYDALDGMTLHLERKHKRWQGNFNTAAGQPVTTVVHEIYGTKDFENLILDLWTSVEEADDGRMHYEFDLPAAHVLAFGVDTRMAALRRYQSYVDFAQK